MVYCPNCQYEHTPETITCPDCRVNLTETIDISKPVATVPDDSWISVAHIKSANQAQNAQKSLDANNIPSIIMPMTFSRLTSAANNSEEAIELIMQTEEILLMVPREYKIEAGLIIKNMLRKENVRDRRE